jgi:membrane protease YdiL (CAAX protease family)
MSAKENLLFWLAVVGSVVLIAVFTTIGQLSIAALPGRWLPFFVYALILTPGAALTLGAVRRLAALCELPPPVRGGIGALGIGATIGSLSVGACASLHVLVDRPSFAAPLWPVLRPGAIIGNIGVATLEEIGFRAGVVHLLAARWGHWAGLLGGSLPFGLLHLGGVVFGRVPSLRHVVGASIAGWLYALLYLKWGVAAPIAAHWAWNSLASNWAKATMLKSLDTIESAWTTIGLYLLLCVLLHFVGPKLGAPARKDN